MASKTLSDFAGFGKKVPLVSLALVMAGLSFAGVPPLGGFIGKYLVFTAALQANLSLARSHRSLNKRTANRIHLPPHERHVLKETQRRNTPSKNPNAYSSPSSSSSPHSSS